MDIQTFQLSGLKAKDPLDPQAFLWKVGNVWICKEISRLEEASQLVKLLEKLNPESSALIFQEVALPELEWGLEKSRNLLLTTQPSQKLIGHFICPLEDWVLPKRQERPISQVRRTFEEITFQVNSETEIYFALLLDIQVQKLLSEIALDAAEEYTLEGSLKDYYHEMKSYLLRTRLLEVKQGKEELLQVMNDLIQSMEPEKNLVIMRSRLAENCVSLKNILGNCLEAIDRIYRNHPELAEIRMEMILLYHLIEAKLPWPKKQIALDLLVKRDKGTLITIRNWDHPKTKWAAALLNSIEEFKRTDLLVKCLLDNTYPIELKERVNFWLKEMNAFPKEISSENNPDLTSLII